MTVLRWLTLVVGAGLLAAGLAGGDLALVRATSTYRDFDVASSQSGVQYLSPGIPDRANEGSYRFDGPVHRGPLIALGVVFLVFWAWRDLGSLDRRLGLRRGLVQWGAFVVTRLGVLRVAGVLAVPRCAGGVYPVLNCQACEMATGACPVGQVQGSILHRRFPALALGTVLVAAAVLGRWICGWLCPFGLFSDMLDRLSLRRWQPSRAWFAGGYVVLAALVAAAGIFLVLGLTQQAPFCSTVCASGKVYGLLPYYSTTALPEMARLEGNGGLPPLLYHGALLALFLVLAVMVSGRVWCRYLCPLGALFGLANRFSWVRIEHRAAHCNDCGKCLESCPMGIDLSREDFLTQSACIRCGRCVAVCPRGARAWVLPWSQGRADRHEPADSRKEPVPAR